MSTEIESTTESVKDAAVSGGVVGVVIIGRNEGTRLLDCIDSVLAQAQHVVYVDSGSTDNSVANARDRGCTIVELDMSRSFSAGRARNSGFRHLTNSFPSITHIQFIDGDCALDPDWITTALAKLGQDGKIAVVCGRRRERYPEATVYNQLCDMEWDTPIGQADACGGDFLVRVDAYQNAGGFDETFAAGEEPELCYRLRQKGWTIWRIDAEMTRHDAAMNRFSQWWKRNMRSGSAYAQSAHTHAFKSGERYNLRDSVSIWLWALVLPLAAFLLAPFTLGASLILLLAYPYLTYRIFKWRRSIGDDKRIAATYSVFCVLGKFPQLEGQIRYFARGESSLIEYKGAP